MRSQAGSGEPTPTEKAMVVRELTVKEGAAAVRGRRTCSRAVPLVCVVLIVSPSNVQAYVFSNSELERILF